MSRLGIGLGAGVLALALCPPAFGWPCWGCCHEKCPPKFVHCQEGPPCIKMKCGCPRPVCDPCHLPHAGYWRTCWQPWPYPPDWSHCCAPPPSVVLHSLPPLPTAAGPQAAAEGPGTQLPAPRKVDGNPRPGI
jgi:hypothetical protein